MSHYQDNINAPHFPPGVHMSHLSLTNTTLIGQEVQQRLWDKYWGQQYLVSPPPCTWPYPDVYFHGYQYGISNTFHSSSIPNGFGQIHHSMTHRFGESNNSVKHGRDVQPCLESSREQNVQVEVLEEGNSWTTDKEKIKGNQKKEGNTLIPKIVDPVTDDLDWDSFSAHLADGIVVSILDSFVLKLPVLDVAMVRSVLEELNNLPSKKEISTDKEQYFHDVVGSNQTQLEQSREKTSSQPEGRKDKGLQDAAVEQSNQTGKSIDKVLEHDSSLAVAIGNKKQHFLGEKWLFETLLSQNDPSTLTQSKEKRPSADEAFGQNESSLGDNDKAKEVQTTISQTMRPSGVLSTTGQKPQEDKSPNQRLTRGAKSNGRNEKGTEHKEYSSNLPVTSIFNKLNSTKETIQKEDNNTDGQVPKTRRSTRAGKTSHEKEDSSNFILKSVNKSNALGSAMEDKEGNSSEKRPRTRIRSKTIQGRLVKR